jgi:hypothetical protein
VTILEMKSVPHRVETVMVALDMVAVRDAMKRHPVDDLIVRWDGAVSISIILAGRKQG